jgi:hypothetical protein
MGVVCARVLGRVIGSHTARLQLGGNRLGDAGVAEVAKALGPALVWISLRSNNISPVGFKKLFQALSKCQKL